MIEEPSVAPPASSSHNEGGTVRVRQGLFILGVSVLVAACTFALWQYSIRQDRLTGENARLARQVQELENQHNGAEHAELEQQRAMAKMLQDSLKRNPADTSLYVQLGAVLIATGDTVGALSAYRKYAVEINPANLGAQTDYGYLLFITGSRAEGKLRTLNVLKKEPKNQIAMYNLAAMSYKEENIDEAILWMDRCIAANSTSEMASMARSAKEQLQSQKKQK
jgi:cytochrome c-type biogenesis protein CcmH/NrfG